MDNNETPDKPKVYKWLLIFVLWLAFTLIVLVFGYPRVKRAIDSSNVITILQENGVSDSSRKNTRMVQVFFITLDGKPTAFPIEQPRLGGSSYHDTFEALMAGPTLEILKKGAVSYIHPKTKLIGLSVSNRILYVDVSKDYILSRNQDKAYEQLKATAVRHTQIKDLVLLVEGSPIE